MTQGEWVVHMSAKEQQKLDVIVKIQSGKLSQKQGQQILGVSERTIRRYLKDYDERGPLFIRHKNCGNKPRNKISNSLKSETVKLVRAKYYDFNMTHALEKLEEDHAIQIKRETFRSWCHEIKHVKRAKRRRSQARYRRDRTEQTGVMLQMDGSHHRWFGGKESCLIATIDDADSDVAFGEFFPSEDTLGCMRVLQKVIEKRGLFTVLYTDKAGIFGGQKRCNFSQVKRAMRQLGIEIIFANSPQAKGRVERLWDTLQDRLVPEMRIRKIRSYERANAYLQDQFLPNEYATRFKVTPKNLESGYRPVPRDLDLNEIFCIKEYRTVNGDHTLSWKNQTYLIKSPVKYSIKKQKIELRTYQDKSWRAFYAGKEIKLEFVEPAKKQCDPKTIHEMKINAGPAQKVRLDGHVQYMKKYYSVDEKYIGLKVDIYHKDQEVRIFYNNELIETHPKLSDQAKASTKPEHLEPWKRSMQPMSPYRKASLNLGKDIDEFVLTVLKSGRGVINNETIWGVLNFQKSVPLADLNEACRSALDLDSPTYKAVRICLKLKGLINESRPNIQVV